MATDMVTSPTASPRTGPSSRAGMRAAHRGHHSWGGYPENVSFAILLMNAGATAHRPLRPAASHGSRRRTREPRHENGPALRLRPHPHLLARRGGAGLRLPDHRGAIIAASRQKVTLAAVQTVLTEFDRLADAAACKAQVAEADAPEMYAAFQGDKLIGAAIKVTDPDGFGGDVAFGRRHRGRQGARHPAALPQGDSGARHQARRGEQHLEQFHGLEVHFGDASR